jgi:linoleoyl-CoA desaturase
VVPLLLYRRHHIKDFDQVRRPDPLTGKRARAIEVGQMLLGKAIHLGLLLVVPLIVLQQPLWQIFVGYACLAAAGGFTLAIVFQLAHCIEGVAFPRVPTDANKMPEAWAEHQLRTTANFGSTPLATFICGGLDHQIEHHLMPRICHIHYPALAPIVEECAREYGLPYIYSGSFFKAVASHARTLRRLGRGDEAEALITPAGRAPSSGSISMSRLAWNLEGRILCE